ncbi:hypothetical protein [Nocardioides sp. W7]|uniref:hypothetical protein n=1 Tax=Nocardioides sp. W7 TaxID=2931390 RepID=UPI001FD406AB|nr:hypothetical protein [Nocardioides sp. W7]
MPRPIRTGALAPVLVAVLWLAGCSADTDEAAERRAEVGGSSAAATGSADPTTSGEVEGDGAGVPGADDVPTEGTVDDAVTEGGATGGADGDAGGTGTNNGAAGGADGVPSDGAPADGPAVDDPSSPYVAAAAAVATRSRDQVLQLHAMSVATDPSADFPKDQVAGLGDLIVRDLDTLLRAATMAVPPAGSPAAELVAALESYRSLAGTIGEWQAGSGLLPDSFFRRLGTTDDQWRAALRDLGELTGENLLKNMPPLAVP